MAVKPVAKSSTNRWLFVGIRLASGCFFNNEKGWVKSIKEATRYTWAEVLMYRPNSNKRYGKYMKESELTKPKKRKRVNR